MKTVLNRINVRLSLVLSFIPALYYAQTSNQNYISERSIRTPITNPAAINSLTAAQQNFKVTYYDAFGRPVQSVIANGSNTAGKDLVNVSEFDLHNRKIKSYLPFVVTASTVGSFVNNADQGALIYYNGVNTGVVNSTSPFAETVYEGSASGKMYGSGQYGVAWDINLNPKTATKQKHEAIAKFEVPSWISHNDKYKQVASNTNGFGSLTPDNMRGAQCKFYFSETEVKKVRTINANGRQTITYHNKLGKVVMIKEQIIDMAIDTLNLYTPRIDSLGFNTTYFVYDNNQNLIYVIPPNAADAFRKNNGFTEVGFTEQQIFFHAMMYAYRYDGRGRRVGTKIPGKEWEVTIYNKADQPVLVQNGTLRAQGKWQFIKYDQFGRAIMTGLYTDATSSIETLHQLANKQSVAYETRTTTNTNFYYSNNSFPNTNLDILTVNYFDTYVATAKAFDTTNAFNVPRNTTALIGLATGSLVKVLGSSPAQYLASTIYYDEYNRPIQTHKEQFASAITWDKINNTYAFDGSLTKSVRYHTGAQNLTLQYRYEYDHAGRKTKTYLKANTDPEVVHSDLQYNELGQLMEKNIHGTGTAPNHTYLQSIDYRYTENGWLSSINNSKLDNIGSNNDGNDAFGMELFYEAPPTNLPINGGVSGQPVKAQYNGNISASIWKAKDINAIAAKVKRQAYSYDYDVADRLTNAQYSKESSPNNNTYTDDVNRFNENITYDGMGNILELIRKGRNNVLVDNLTYAYFSFDVNPFSIPFNGIGTPPTNTGEVYTAANFRFFRTGVPRMSGTNYTFRTHLLGSVVDAAIKDVNFNDFKDLKVGGTAQKYAYDTDGRLINDSAKKVNYAYNHLDLPTSITNTVNGQSLQFTYDASGRKLARTIPGTATIHYYMDGIESEFVPAVTASASSPVLLNTMSTTTTSSTSGSVGSGTYDIKFAITEEGRIRPKTVAANTYFFDYYLKDHLGNIRVSLTDELPIVSYPVCSVEDRVTTGPTYNNHIQYERLFYNIPPSRISTIASGTFDFNNPTLSSPPTLAQKNAINKKCIRLLHSTTNDSLKAWIPKILKVNSGDKISATVNAFYTGTINNTSAAGNGFFSNFINTMVNQVPAGIPTSDIITKLQSNFSNNANAYSGTVNSIYNNTYDTTTNYNNGTKPKAYLLILFYDNDFNLLKDQSYIREIQTNANNKDIMTLTDRIANVAGYCQIAVVNESTSAVLFDKFQLTHKQSNTSEISEYYPFGLQNQQTSSTQFGSKEQRYKYNGKELMKDFGLESEDYGARLYSPQIGRWSLVDKHADANPAWTPYRAFYNNPMRYVDPDGNIELPASMAKSHPIFYNYMKNNYAKDVMGSPAILSAMKNCSFGNVTDNQIRKAVSWEAPNSTNRYGPIVMLESNIGGLNGAGHFDQYKEVDGKVRKDVMTLSKANIDALEKVLASNVSAEKKLKALFAVFMTVNHETTHFLDYLDGYQYIDENGNSPDVGNMFDDAVWRYKIENGVQKTLIGHDAYNSENMDDIMDRINKELKDKNSEENRRNAGLPTLPN